MTQTIRSALLSSEAFHRALVNAGILREEDRARRIVIDAQANEGVLMYVERWGDTRLLDVALTLDGIEIRGVPADPDA